MYGLVALGYHITWVTSRTMNFSQGHAVMAGAVVAFAFYVGLGWPLWATVLATLVVLAIFGVALERVAVRPFFRAASAVWLLSTIACGIIAENVAMLLFGKDDPVMDHDDEHDRGQHDGIQGSQHGSQERGINAQVHGVALTRNSPPTFR